MKKLLTLIVATLVALPLAFTQSLALVDADTLVTYDPNGFLVTVHGKVVNTSSNTLYVKASRIFNDIGEGQESYFCWDVCYGPAVDNSLGALELGPGDSTSAFSLYLDPKGISYKATITMMFFDRDNPTDTVTQVFTFESLNNTAIGDEFDALSALSNPYPNPAREQAFVDYNLPIGVSQAQLKVYNLLGRQVKQINLNNGRNKATILTEGMTPGVYFIYLVAENREITSRKLIVTK